MNLYNYIFVHISCAPMQLFYIQFICLFEERRVNASSSVKCVNTKNDRTSNFFLII